MQAGPGRDEGVRGVAHGLPLIGREAELRALRAMLQRGRALLLGPRGIGKTRLLEEAARQWPMRPVPVRGAHTLHPLLEQLLPQIAAGAGSAMQLRRLPSQTLQARALEALHARPAWLVLDEPDFCDARCYRFLERVSWIDGCCIAAAAASRAQLGYLSRLLWDPREELTLGPLSRAASARLLEEAIRAFGLASLGPLDDFRRKALAASEGNPGRIVTLCRMAAQPQYWHGGRLLFAPLWIDVLTQLA
jgi:hypothetical protein